MSKVHVGDIGTVLRVKIVDEDGSGVDVSAATTKTLKLLKADGSCVEKDAEFTTDGTDSYIEYVTIAGDILEGHKGGWKIQGFVITPIFSAHSSIDKFNVYENLC
jgi:hypothetical protein